MFESIIRIALFPISDTLKLKNRELKEVTIPLFIISKLPLQKLKDKSNKNFPDFLSFEAQSFICPNIVH